LAIGDGAWGFWKALRHVYGQTRWQRCWVHKTANVLDKLPKALQPKAKQRLQAIWMAPDRQRAEKVFDVFVATYEAKYPKAAECLAQDREVLLAFYDFPAGHWGHIQTTNPIASTFATMLAMVFKLWQSAAKRWHRLRAAHYLPEVMNGMAFKDGIRGEQDAA
jgi:putative transposase